ncbi:receptor-like protein 35 [Eucalyptus grandis]|uniref:receptor-like protein 35 n=1 Tax=Eucalyptus grandis TaxID=71139 RepID=UPI00192E90A5|nr:receptor-like protein 35 [Eucalyptus grandis]
MPNSTSLFCQTDGFWSTTPKMLSWNADKDCCSWEGVTCDHMTGHVIRLELGCYPPSQTCYSSVASSNSTKLSSLGSLNLSSPHKAERPSGSNSDMLLQNLTMLRILILDQLNMSGIDVSHLMNLPPSLEVLSLSSCQLRGTLAANIFLLPKLTCLNLSGNKELSGYLPESTWNSSLKVLDLSSTGFSGVLPESIGDLHSLETLLLQQCNFIGSIPLSLGNLTRLTRLEFSSNKLSGEVPPTLSNIDRLTLLDLSFNNFTGPIPNVFDNKTQLQKLLFSHNQFEGPIPPSIKNLSNLAQLEISNNLIWGSIPSSLFSLPSLTRLDLSNNRLSGHVNEFLAAPSLDHVDLSGNKLRGSIPNSIFQLGNLTYLSISGNNLTSVLDQRLLSRLINLKDLDLSDNILSLSNSITIDHVLPKLSKVSLSGCNITVMPTFLRNSTSVEYLDLSRNIIHGDIPPWMWDVGTESLSYLNISHNSLTSFEQVPWENLIVLDLYSNLIQGPFLPLSLPNSVRVFSLARNQVTGYIPGSICEMKGLQILDLSHNNFTGTIPHCLGNISDSLVVLDLQENGISGTISLTFGENAVLRSLHLNGNKFEGLLPRSVINCKQLEALDLSGNKLNDTFPRWLEILPSLRVLFLRSNRLRGSIANPKTEFPFPQLRILDLSSNEFTGPLPSTYFAKLKAMVSTDQDGSELRYMDQGYYQDSVTEIIKGIEVNLPKILVTRTTVDLSSNKFQGMIPDVIGELGSLKGLNLSHNNLDGHIPSSLGDLSKLEWLDLSSNELSGMLPTELTNLTFLEVLNVSSNQLTGPIPRGNQFNTFQAESYRGNLGLCGFPLSKSCADSRAPGKLPVLPEGGVHLVFADFVEPEAVEIGLLCGIVLGLVMSNLQYLRSFWRAKREVRKIARKHIGALKLIRLITIGRLD